VDGLADALISLLSESDARGSRGESFKALAEQLTWEQVMKPLSRYCQQPWHAADAGDSFVKRWEGAEHDRILARAAGAQRRLRELEARMGQQSEGKDAQIQLAAMSRELAACEARLQAAMNGRVMRLMTGLQRAARRLQGHHAEN
jgi:hypothetical protein